MFSEKAPAEVDEHAPSSTRSNMNEIDHQAEDKLVRRIDKFVVPTVMLAYLLCFLDRTNIGNARLFGLEEDLGLEGSQYQIAVAVLFVPYVLIEVPSNLVLKKLRPSRWLSFITVSWGIVSTCTGFVQNFTGLVAVRVLLGLLEGGLLPGLTVYLTLFYTKKEIALRIGFLFVSSALAGACGGLLAYCISFMDGVAGYSGWRWVFILEGVPTVVFGVVLVFILADEPRNAWFLSEDEKQLLLARLQRQVGFHEDFDRKDAILAAKDWKTWCFAVGQFTVNTMLYSYSVFLPSIIQGLGQWTSPQAQALTIPCYALGAISYLAVGWISDRQQLRGLYQVMSLIVCIIGYGISLAPVAAAVHYFAMFVISVGLFVAVGLPLAWLPSNNPRYGKRTTASGIQITICNCSGILAPFLYPKTDAPRYVMGYSVSMGLLGLGVFIYSFLLLHFHRINKRRKAGKEDYKIEGMTDEEVNALGDRSPRFVYTI
ncbi:putative MFS transporter [Emericellopsis atlantica]|uniref:MFS transporter n=1 Tax=Emericellopsis atlantica TaxID=2614577 RepID=A0A9P7ZI49_9HYPO|nr:putative MFS transporter [Emericellopsis atlantica]KAG9251913.1 putative MFS transporter [Emericellopsis atlantica]